MIRLAAALAVSLLAVPAWAGNLALKRVMLSSGGVGYFEYDAEIDGDQVLGLDVPLGQVDDILKSLVVFDAAGRVAGVELPGRDMTVEAFGDAPFGPEALQSPIAYLNALRGTEVTVSGPRPMSGRLMRAEPFAETNGTASTPRSRITLLAPEGLRQFVLEDAGSVQITDPALRARVAHALEALRADASLTARHLTIRLKGTGKRVVTVGYVAGAPLWKATYRVMLPPASGKTARLQGWATLENQSGTDWKNVALTLLYGNPVTFRQALYRSYFVQRPEVPVEILGHVLPSVDTRARAAPSPPADAPAPAPAQGMMLKREQSTARTAEKPLAEAADPAGIAETGEETIFTVAQPVDLAAGHSANVPIVDRDIPMKRVGLVPFMRPHPLASVRIVNDEPRGLPAGVLTLYETAGFAGDARLGGLPAGESRLLSYAQDLRTNVETARVPAEATVVALTAADGVLTLTQRRRQILRVTITGPASDSRDLLLEFPKSGVDQTVSFEDPKITLTEQTATAFRAAVTVSAGETKTITARIDQPETETISLEDGDDQALLTVINAAALPKAGRDGLRRILDLRRDETRKTDDIEAKTKLLDAIQADEDRLRKNLAAVTAADPLRARLTRALDADETKIEQLRKAMDDAQNDAAKAHRALLDAIAAFKI